MRRVLTILASLGLLGTVVIVLGASKAGESKAVLEQRLNEMRKARVQSAKAALAAAQAAFDAQSVTVDVFVEVTRNLVDAELDLATTPEQEIASWERYVKVMKQSEDANKKLLEIGVKGGEPLRYYTVKQERERAEIALLKARIKAAP
jgi:hypothetical protein